MPDQWYYTENRQRKGPISEDELKKLASAGQLKPSDLVWKDGMAAWGPASEIAGLFSSSTEDEPPLLDDEEPPPPSPSDDEPPPLENAVPAAAPSPSIGSSKKRPRQKVSPVSRIVGSAIAGVLGLLVAYGLYCWLGGKSGDKSEPRGDRQVAKSDSERAAQPNGTPSGSTRTAPKSSTVPAVSPRPQAAPVTIPTASNPKSADTAQTPPASEKPTSSTAPRTSPIAPAFTPAPQPAADRDESSTTVSYRFLDDGDLEKFVVQGPHKIGVGGGLAFLKHADEPLGRATTKAHFTYPITIEYRVKCEEDGVQDIWLGLAGVRLHWGTWVNTKTALFLGADRSWLPHDKIVPNRLYHIVFTINKERLLTIRIDGGVIVQRSLPESVNLRGPVVAAGGCGHVIYKQVTIRGTPAD